MFFTVYRFSPSPPSRDMEWDPKGSILYADRVVSGVIPLPTIVWKKSGRYCFVTLRWLRILSFCTPFVKWVQLLYLHLFVLFVGDMIPNIVLSYFVELIYLGWIDLADSITRIDGLNDMRPVSSNCLRKKKSGGHLDHERSTEDSSHFSGWE